MNDLRTGYGEVDNIIGTLEKGSLYVVAGRPSIGKTSFITNISTYLVNKKNNVLFFSLQLTEEQIWNRVISSTAHIDSYRILEDMDNIESEIKNLEYKNLKVIDNYDLSIEEIVEKIQVEEKLNLVVVDYLQIINSEKKYDERREELDYILRSLKQVSKSKNIPIILVSSLSRECEKRMDRRPILSDLRDTGAIEDIASAVLFIYRAEVYNDDYENKNLAEIIIAKNNFGKIGVARLAWMSKFFLFGNLES